MGVLVSAIITTCERPLLLERAIDSVYSQSHSPIECIVINDGFDLETVRILEERKNRYENFKFVNFRSRNQSAALNLGIAIAEGELLAFLDDDDIWLNSKIEKQVKRLEETDPECGLIYTWFDFRSGDKILESRTPTVEGYIFQSMIVSQAVGNTSTLLVRKRAAVSVGGFDENMPRGRDGDFIRRLSLQWKVAVVPEVLTWVYVDHGHQRITDYSEKGLRKALEAHISKIEKFKGILESYPSETAELYSIIGLHYAMLRELGKAIRYFKLAFSTKLFSPPTIMNGLRALRFLCRRNARAVAR